MGRVATANSGRKRVDRALIKAITAEDGVIGVWRAWRFPSDGAPWPPPKRVYTIEVGPDVDQVALTAGLQAKLITVGEAHPQVEVYPVGADLPVYQRLARAYGELVWAAEENPDIQIAVVFDEVDAETGPHFFPDHARLDDDEADKVAGYLYQGEPLLVTTARMEDVVATARVYSVPMSFRTDGTWIWTEASAYYVKEHRLEPDAGLLAHIRELDHTAPTVDGVGLYRALQVLQEPAEEEPVWTFGGAPELELGAGAGGR